MIEYIIVHMSSNIFYLLIANWNPQTLTSSTRNYFSGHLRIGMKPKKKKCERSEIYKQFYITDLLHLCPRFLIKTKTNTTFSKYSCICNYAIGHITAFTIIFFKTII